MAIIKITGVDLNGTYSATLYQQIGESPSPSVDMYLNALTLDNDTYDFPMEDGKYWLLTGFEFPTEEPTE